MPRIRRLILPGYPHHVIQRGNNRKKVFLREYDREIYLKLLSIFSRKWDNDILGYCLMDNHVHILVVPKQNHSLAKMMQGLSLSYTQIFNKNYKRTGRLWESRFYSSIVDRDEYLWSLLRYIERNPIRANIVKDACGYPWSSARIHVEDEKNSFVKDSAYIKQRFGILGEKDYADYLKEEEDMKQSQSLFKNTIRGIPIGSNDLIKKVEEKFRISFSIRPRGRPRLSST
jgi:putative transposase